MGIGHRSQMAYRLRPAFSVSPPVPRSLPEARRPAHRGTGPPYGFRSPPYPAPGWSEAEVRCSRSSARFAAGPDIARRNPGRAAQAGFRIAWTANSSGVTRRSPHRDTKSPSSSARGVGLEHAPVEERPVLGRFVGQQDFDELDLFGSGKHHGGPCAAQEHLAVLLHQCPGEAMEGADREFSERAPGSRSYAAPQIGRRSPGRRTEPKTPSEGVISELIR